MDSQHSDGGRPQRLAPGFMLLAGLCTACLFIFILLAYGVVYRHHDSFDLSVSAYFARHRSGPLLQMMRFITFFGSSFFLLPAYVLLTGFLVIRRDFHAAIAVPVISFASWLTLSELKLLFHRRRPHLPLVTDITTYSFPSAHMFSSLIFFCLLAFTFSKRQRHSSRKWVGTALILLFPIAVGISRIVLNVHYTTDVIAGFCLGIAWLILSYLLFRKIAAPEQNYLQ